MDQLYAAISQILSPGAEAAGAKTGGTRRSDGCNAARAALSDAQEESRRWNLLVLIVGIAAAITIAVLILQLTDLNASIDKVKAAGAAGGALLSGGMTTFLVGRSNAAKKDVRRWADLVHTRCKPADDT